MLLVIGWSPTPRMPSKIPLPSLTIKSLNYQSPYIETNFICNADLCFGQNNQTDNFTFDMDQ